MKDQLDYSNKFIRKDKVSIVIRPPDTNTPLNDTTMPSEDSFETNPKVQVSSPLTLDNATLNPQVGEQGRRYPLHDLKEPNKLGFSKSSSNIVYPISDFVSYHRLSKTHLAFALQLSSLSIPNHFQEAFEDPKWKFAMVEEMKPLQKTLLGRWSSSLRERR